MGFDICTNIGDIEDIPLHLKFDLSVLSAVLSPADKHNMEKIDLIIMHLNEIRRALLQSDSTHEVLKQTALINLTEVQL